MPTVVSGIIAEIIVSDPDHIALQLLTYAFLHASTGERREKKNWRKEIRIFDL